MQRMISFGVYHVVLGHLSRINGTLVCIHMAQPVVCWIAVVYCKQAWALEHSIRGLVPTAYMVHLTLQFCTPRAPHFSDRATAAICKGTD